MSIYVCEHKTTTDNLGLGSTYWRMLTLDNQISTYVTGAKSLGHDVDGVLYDVLRKPALRPLMATPVESRKYKADGSLYANQRDRDETPAAYRDRCMAVIAEEPDRHYQRGVVVRLESEERDAANDAWQTAEQIRLSTNSERWPRNVSACRQYSRMCEFWDGCSGVASFDDTSRYVVGEAHSELETKHHLPLLTTSSMRAYRSCPRKYHLRYERGLRGVERAGVLVFGTRIHAALEAWFTSNRSLDAALDALKLEPYDFDGAKAEAMIRGYHTRWADEALDVLAVEKEFVAPLVNPTTGAASRTFALAGKVDAIVATQG